jgi:hypothetical protein
MAEVSGLRARSRRRVDRPLLVLAVAPVVAVAAALAVMHLVGPTGVDAAAHVYKTGLVARGQSLFWDDLWYAGSYGVASYGVVYYLLARLVGAAPIVVLSAGLLPMLFHLYVRRAWRVTSLLPAVALTVVIVFYLANGQDPFLLAMALTMSGLVLLAHDHPLWAALPVGVAAFTNPVAVVAGAVFVLAEALAWRPARRRAALLVVALVPFVVVWLGVLLAFRGRASYLAQPAELLKWTAVAAVGIALARLSDDPDRRAKQILFAVAGALCLAAIVVPTELGNNAARFLALFGLPALLMVRRVRLPRAGGGGGGGGGGGPGGRPPPPSSSPRRSPTCCTQATLPRPSRRSSPRSWPSRAATTVPTFATTSSPCGCTGRPATSPRRACRSLAAGFGKATGSTTRSSTTRRRRPSTSPGCATSA